MNLFRFDKKTGKKISRFNSDFIMSRVIQTEKAAHIGCYHQAVAPQLLLIMVGEGYVRGKEEEYVKVKAGDAVFFEKDEWHETKTIDGLTAIVIESEELTPSTYMPFKEGVSSNKY
ncbi:cupin [Bacillus mangrovi]|uniref:Cupin n=1 Tax=Metabacillus mangrovi TaxID=1491830 RepID=A0A7X2S5L2_9BACI|nr:cupin [Metabacillus mangrovi]MTH54099.1 cupin [Metabacillus mangrovi]